MRMCDKILATDKHNVSGKVNILDLKKKNYMSNVGFSQ